MWPSLTGTRKHCAEITGSRAGTMRAPSIGAPDLHRLLFALLFFAADEWDHVVVHLGERRVRLPGAGERLVRRDRHLLQAEVAERVERGDVALERAVRLHGDEAALRSEAAALRDDELRVLRVHLGDHHRHVGRRAVRGVVRDERRLVLGVRVLERARLVLGHVDRAEHEVDSRPRSLARRTRRARRARTSPWASSPRGPSDPRTLPRTCARPTSRSPRSS